MNPTRVLVVDDEPSLLGVLRRYLTRLGYDVVTAPEGGEACRLFEAAPASFSLVLTDMSLADLSCTEMLSRMVALNPRLGLIVSSGHHLEYVSLPETLRDRVAFLQKPFLPKTLAKTMEMVLGARRAAAG